MSFFDRLPKDADSAFQFTLIELQNAADAYPNGALNAETKTQAVIYIRALQAISRRLPQSEDYEELLEQIHRQAISNGAATVKKSLDLLQQLYLSNSLDNHFIDEEEEALFNEVKWSGDDRALVLDHLSNARRAVTDSSGFDDHHKRRVLYWLARAENEALKEKGRFATFVAATSEVLSLAEEAGEKGKPLANLVQMVRTATRRNVTVNQIEADEKPKQIAPPTDKQD
ncbi:hypothetical protein T8A63_07395 [Sulfitobacter sp. OXR-159]|uniref:hypothetical protein n=1 Tax=Sulfitobacter sp. OXR-159 TaxID=3100174 RepID=UPI002AC958FE|nr:hypothetical protein [Sulfitobacter sp. OXR-159]WPZ30780.1 hypothetical protein T8A63_06885 [Sulfitobacter sp. OXR-159]WPZ30881.1 hypothetical protein T8A63_07395 [Sulfitobacter sp. OXR-159]